MKFAKKEYQNYRFKCKLIKEYRVFFEKGSTTDRNYMNAQMLEHLDYFEIHKVYELKNIIELLHDIRCRSPYQQKLIEEFVIHMKDTKNVDIFLLKKREMKKANGGERNILMNRLALEYPNEFFSFVIKFINQNFPDMENKEEFYKKIKSMINELINQPTVANQLDKIKDFGSITNQSDQFDVIIDDSFDQFDLFFSCETMFL